MLDCSEVERSGTTNNIPKIAVATAGNICIGHFDGPLLCFAIAATSIGGNNKNTNNIDELETVKFPGNK